MASGTGGAWTLNNATKYVACKTLKRGDWKNSQLIKGDVPPRSLTLT